MAKTAPAYRSSPHLYDRPGRYIIAVKVVDSFGNDTMTSVLANAGCATRILVVARPPDPLQLGEACVQQV